MSIAFEQMMDNIFKNMDFLETFTIDGMIYKCISSAITDGISFTNVGVEEEESFTLDVKLPVYHMPVKGQKLIYHDKTYKVNDVQTDSAGTSIKIHVIDLSKGIGK